MLGRLLLFENKYEFSFRKQPLHDKWLIVVVPKKHLQCIVYDYLKPRQKGEVQSELLYPVSCPDKSWQWFHNVLMCRIHKSYCVLTPYSLTSELFYTSEHQLFCACTNSRATLFVYAQCTWCLATIRVIPIVRIKSEKRLIYTQCLCRNELT